MGNTKLFDHNLKVNILFYTGRIFRNLAIKNKIFVKEKVDFESTKTFKPFFFVTMMDL